MDYSLSKIADGLACPKCGGGVIAELTGALRCELCAQAYPTFGRIPCLIDDPGLWRTLWLRRLDDYSSSIEARVAMLRQEVESANLLPRTRDRLTRIAVGLAQQLEGITALFDGVDKGGDEFAASAIPSRPEPNVKAAILDCYEHLFRDWVWGDAECKRGLELVEELVPPEPGRVAVYGAGAGRLAVDLHQALTTAVRTYAVDINPVPFLALDRLLAGESLTLPEFPVDPTSDASVVVPRTLALPSPVREGFVPLFADALRPPFAPGSLDVVVTSWFIDVVPADLRQTAAMINRVLRPGGIWVNWGPLRFSPALTRSYTIEEVFDVVGASAFELASPDRQDVPYFHSPVSGSRTTDTTYRFAARKTGAAPPVEISPSMPPWVANPLLPIPITPALIAIGRTSVFTTGVLAMIDGERSIVDVTRELGAAWGVDPARLQDELRVFFSKIPSGA